MKGIRFGNVIAIWKLIQAQLHVDFSTIFIIKRASVILFIYETVAIKHHFETKKIIMKCPTIKILHEIIYSSQFKKYNCSPMHSYNRKIWVGIPSYVTFPWTETQTNITDILFLIWNKQLSWSSLVDIATMHHLEH